MAAVGLLLQKASLPDMGSAGHAGLFQKNGGLEISAP
jgi:hypothetical protein